MTRGRRLELSWAEHGGRDCLRVRGWTEAELREFGRLAAAELGRRLGVLPSELVGAAAHIRTLQPLAGRFAVNEDSICFIPRFPFLNGMSYSLVVYSGLVGGLAGELETWPIQRPSQTGAPTTSVVAIYPTAEAVPVNQLKLYIHFSSPMSEGGATRSVHVRRADNDEPLDDVFLAMEPELWDPERRRLTLLLDPGRIKRGLVPHEEASYPLAEGVPVVVSIDAEFRDAAGQPLRTGMERRYKVEPAVRVRVNPADWRFRYPAAGSLSPLTVEFDRPLDHALLEHSLWVNNAAGAPVAGRGSIGPGERSWRFEPRSPWEEGRYVVDVDPRLEDLAGNSLIRMFDRDLMRAEDVPVDVRAVAIEFTCAPASQPLRTKPTA